MCSSDLILGNFFNKVSILKSKFFNRQFSYDDLCLSVSEVYESKTANEWTVGIIKSSMN